MEHREPTQHSPELTSAQDAAIESLLRADAAARQLPPIADAGFSARVMAALPPRAAAPSVVSSRRLNLWQRSALVVGPSLAAAVFIGASNRTEAFFIDATMDIATQTVTPNVVALALLVLVGCVGAVLAVAREK